MIRIGILLKAKSPICHLGDEKTGSEALFRRLRFVVGDKEIEVPYVSGNEIRGKLRRMVFKDFFEQIGYGLKSLKLYHSFFSGGVLETTAAEESGMLDIEMRKKVRELVPPVSLLGCALGNQVFSGKLYIMHALPLCKELKEYLPDKYAELCNKSFYQLLDWSFHTRRAEVPRESKEEQAVQMLYRFEVLIPGTQLYTEIRATDLTPVEQSCLARMIELWKEEPFIGGRSSSGYGEVEINVDTSIKLDSKPYLEFLKKKRNEIIGLIKELEESMGS